MCFYQKYFLFLSLYKDFVSVVSTAPNNVVIVSLTDQSLSVVVLSILVNTQHHLFFLSLDKSWFCYAAHLLKSLSLLHFLVYFRFFSFLYHSRHCY